MCRVPGLGLRFTADCGNVYQLRLPAICPRGLRFGD